VPNRVPQSISTSDQLYSPDYGVLLLDVEAIVANRITDQVSPVWRV